MGVKIGLFVGGLVLLLPLSCSRPPGQQPSTPPTSDREEQPADPQTRRGESDDMEVRPILAVLGIWGEGPAGQYVVDSGQDWEEMWDGRIEEAPAMPEGVDFSMHTVIGVFMGEQPTAGHFIRVEEVWVGQEGSRVILAEMVPQPDCVTAQVISHPSQVVVVEKVTRPVEFVTIKREIPC